MASIKTIRLTKSGGEVTFDKEPSAVFSTIRNGKYTLTIKRDSEKRSIDQNSLMWMWFEHISRETGTPKNDVKIYYCAKFLTKRVGLNDNYLNGVEETKNLSKEQMSEFLDNIHADAATELGIRLPLPEDRYFEQFYQTYNQ